MKYYYGGGEYYEVLCDGSYSWLRRYEPKKPSPHQFIFNVDFEQRVPDLIILLLDICTD